MLVDLEKPSRAWPEILPILTKHYADWAVFSDEIPCDVDLDFYGTLEMQGRLLCATLREKGKLVGYMTAFLMPYRYSKGVLTLSGDMVYIIPKYRGRFGFTKLARVILDEAQRRGARLLTMDEGQSPVVGVYLQREGFTALSRTFAKWAGDGHGDRRGGNRG